LTAGSDEADQRVLGTREGVRERTLGGGRRVVALGCIVLPLPQQDLQICKQLGIPFDPGRVVKGGVVKANGKASREIATYVRSEHGLLIDRTSEPGDSFSGPSHLRLVDP
jgi:hypothetical protein